MVGKKLEATGKRLEKVGQRLARIEASGLAASAADPSPDAWAAWLQEAGLGDPNPGRLDQLEAGDDVGQALDNFGIPAAGTAPIVPAWSSQHPAWKADQS